MDNWVIIALVTAACSVIIGVLFWHTWLKWWEVLLMLPVPFAVGGFVQLSAMNYAVTDKEYVTSYVKVAHYYEHWNELQTRTRVVRVGKISVVQTYHVTVDHPPRWTVRNTFGNEREVSKSFYESLVKEWGNEKKVELRRNSHTIDGDRFDTEFPGDDDKLKLFTFRQEYENRTQTSLSVFGYDTTPTGPVVPYPIASSKNLTQTCVLGEASPQEHHALDAVNARLSSDMGINVRIWVIVFTDTPVSIARQQEIAWLGGKRNEIVICIGKTKQGEVNWCQVFGWTQANVLKSSIKQEVMSQPKLDLIQLAGYLRESVPKSYQLRDFREFDYLPVDLPGWVYFLEFVLCVLANAGLTVWLVKNEHHDNPDA